MHMEELSYRVYSHNIRYDNHRPVENERYWSERKHGVIASIRFNAERSTIVCLQEVLHNALEDILNGLGDDWSYFGVGRDDGKTRGEYAPILFRKSQWELVDSNTFWLSETPDRPSRGWDAVLPRIVTFVRLRHRETGREIAAFNTHYDHIGKKAREESSKLIIHKMNEQMGEDHSTPVTLCGDFNSSRDDIAYKTLSKQLIDSGEVLEKHARYGHSGVTYTGFNRHETPSYIDFIWYPKTADMTQTTFGILHSEYHGFLLSDHRPVSIDLVV
ncbi:hypothetical protein TRVA0_016S00694 [Trichomonascus vanleenenianus]|uniref:endonuclease/exonuclease/phosphatase family protein n=1 Tax=Trichomonascus vanleenenianus TaxID=2268995 RepID=UPI003EC9B953